MTARVCLLLLLQLVWDFRSMVRHQLFFFFISLVKVSEKENLAFGTTRDVVSDYPGTFEWWSALSAQMQAMIWLHHHGQMETRRHVLNSYVLECLSAGFSSSALLWMCSCFCGQIKCTQCGLKPTRNYPKSDFCRCQIWEQYH